MNQADRLLELLREIVREEVSREPSEAIPASLEAERAILGSIMLDNSVLASLRGFPVEDFSLASHREIFGKMRTLGAVDIVTLSNAFSAQALAEIGGVAFLASLTEGLPRRPAIEEYVRIVQEKARLRRIVGACEDAIKRAMEQREPASEIVASLGMALKGMGKRK
jgi:replicative DNA helicase